MIVVSLAIYNHEADQGVFHLGLKDPQATIQKETFSCQVQWKNDACIDASFTNKDDLQPIIKAIQDARPVEGILDTATEYDLELLYADETVYHYSLSLGFEHNARTEGLIIDRSNDHQGYRLSNTDTNQLRNRILQSATFSEGLPKPTVQSEGQEMAVYWGAYCSSSWNQQTYSVENVCAIPQAPEILNQAIQSQAISLTPQSQIKVDFPIKPAKIEVYMVKNGEHFPVEIDTNGKCRVSEQRGYAQYMISATWNKDNHSKYYWGVYIR